MKKLVSIFFFILFAGLITAQVSKTVNVTTAGTLSTLLTATEKTTITNLTLTGNIDARDVKCMRDEMTVLAVIDISAVNVKAYTGTSGTYYDDNNNFTYLANEMPEGSFSKYSMVPKYTLTSIIMPNSLTSIGKGPLSYCRNLSSITIPYGVTNIGTSAFQCCTGLTSIIIPSNVTTIGSWAFFGCTNLNSIKISASVTSIGDNAFKDCSGFKTIIFLNPLPPTLSTNAFLNVSPSIVYVPIGSVVAYKAASGYSSFNIDEYKLKATIGNISTITLTTALLNASIDLITDTPVSAHGFCWNTTGSPTITDTKVDNGAKTTVGSFSNTISGLSPKTIYYVRSYATDGASTVYGSQVSFTTASIPDAAGTISGNQTVCQGQNAVTYTVPVISSATSYIWSLPTGVTGTSTTNSITVNYAKSATSGNITVKGHNEWGDGVSSSLAVSVTALPVNCTDSLSLSSNIAYPVKITLNTLGYGPDNIELAVYAEDSTTIVCRFNKYVAAPTDTTLYLGAGKYYLVLLNGGASLTPPVLSGNNVSVSGWQRMTQFIGLPFKVIAKDIVCEGAALLNANVTYKGIGKLRYKWTPSTGLNNDSITTPTATVSTRTNYTVTVTSIYGCTATSSVNVPVGLLTANAGIDRTVICGNTMQLSSVITNYTGPGKLRYKWTPSTGLNNDTIINPTATVANDITYTVTVTAPSGCTASDNIKITVSPIIANAGADKTVICGGAVQLNTVTTNYTGIRALKYKWTPSTGLSNDTIAGPTATVITNTTYTVTVTTPNGCTASDNIFVGITPMTKPEIGIVGIINNKNRVVWNKPVSTGISAYNIYKETTVSNVYEKVGSVSYDSLSVFVDNQSAPDVKSNKYKLSVIDKSGLESPQSNAHKTMHLSINKGQNNAWNLIWEPYEGFAVSTYNIYRGTSPNSLNFLDATSGSSTQYSDLSASAGDVYYQLEVISPTLVSPTKVPQASQKVKEDGSVITTALVSYGSSRSNVATNVLSAISKISDEQNICLYPNPVKDELRINFEGGSKFDIVNLLGVIVFNGDLKENNIVKTSNLIQGVYLIRFKQANSILTKKFIKM